MNKLMTVTPAGRLANRATAISWWVLNFAFLVFIGTCLLSVPIAFLYALSLSH